MAAAAMLLASCSNEADSPKIDDNNNTVDALTLTSLSPQSQASRIQKINGTRDGEKKQRLTLVEKVSPVLAAADYTWSATGVAFANNNVYVTWHSDRQAHRPGVAADRWGGAIDVLTSGADGNLGFGNTVTSYEAKFNNVTADGSNLYVSLTSGKNGAAVGRVNVPPVYTGGQEIMDTIVVPGSSVNCVVIDGNTAYAVSGYKGGAFSFSKNFAKKAEINTLCDYSEDFGGKYIAGGYILRTDAEHCYIVPQNSRQPIVTGAPLVSSEKYAESFDPETGNWTIINTDEDGQSVSPVKYYGKHTMAVDGNYIYVAGGKAAKGTKDGLRVYDKTTGQQVWGNATNTTAVCVAGNYVYAATGAGLRVYKKYDAAKNTLELFAFETVDGTDEDGNAIKEAGTDAHSCNYVAVAGNRIYMANGQSGLYIFTLDTTAPAEEVTPAE